jgi:hypothetical protein
MSIFGLPLMNNYFTIFDRSVDRGLGVIKCAPIKRPGGAIAAKAKNAPPKRPKK